jgi:exopolysaccharide biosynthesis polyprenyl glycosylphosphotransferase
VNGPFTDADVVAVAEATAPLSVASPAPNISYGTALWIARLGRVGALWLPISTICLAHSTNSWAALQATILFVICWKAALRRSYSDASVTVWTIGSAVPAAVGAVTGALLVTPLAVWAPGLSITGRTLLELTVAVFLTSTVWEAMVARSLAARRRILVVGTASGGVGLLEDVSLAPGLPFEVIGVVDDERGTDHVAGVPLLGTVQDLSAIILEHRPQIVVLTDDRSRAEAFSHLLELGHIGFSVVGLPEFYEYAFGRLPVRALTPLWFMGILHLYRRPYSQASKRAFDFGVALIAVLLVAPILPILWLAVRRTGPAIFKQVRLGAGGKPFVIYKFRTMRVDAEPNGAVWAAEHDPRVTKLGCFMRKSRLDELPQLWNVLKGEMSVVGPRPERPEFVAELETEVPFWGRRHLVKPGITGWAQVRRGYTSDAAGTGDKLSYDLWYLRHRSLVVDLAICAKTISTLVTGSGAR